MVGRAALIATTSRLAVVAFVVGLSFVVEPYDSSQSVGSAAFTPRSVADKFVLHHLSRFTNWDGVFFAHLSSEGYEYEQFHAFFPLFPITICGAR